MAGVLAASVRVMQQILGRIAQVGCHHRGSAAQALSRLVEQHFHPVAQLPRFAVDQLAATSTPVIVGSWADLHHPAQQPEGIPKALAFLGSLSPFAALSLPVSVEPTPSAHAHPACPRWLLAPAPPSSTAGYSLWCRQSGQPLPSSNLAR